MTCVVLRISQVHIYIYPLLKLCGGDDSNYDIHCNMYTVNRNGSVWVWSMGGAL